MMSKQKNGMKTRRSGDAIMGIQKGPDYTVPSFSNAESNAKIVRDLNCTQAVPGNHDLETLDTPTKIENVL